MVVKILIDEMALSFITDLVDFHEMLRLPSERQHYKAGYSLVYSIIWVREHFICIHCVCSSVIMLNDAVHRP